MAIIDHKRLEAEQERARQRAAEYAARHDSMSAPGMSAEDGRADNDDNEEAGVGDRRPWDMHPPPAYEEANRNASASTSSSAVPSARLQPPSSSLDRDVEGATSHADASESTPLLSGSTGQGEGTSRGRGGEGDERRWSRSSLKSKAKRKIRKAAHFLLAGAIVAGIALLIIFSTLNHDPSQDGIIPSPPTSDGHPVDEPSWSSPVRLPSDMWPGPNVVLYSTRTFFDFPVSDEEFFISAKGSTYSGQIVVVDSATISDEEWSKHTGSKIFDRIVVEVESRFTEKWLRDSVLVRKMQRDYGKGVGLGVYSGSRNWDLSSQFVSFHITVYLPLHERRTNSASRLPNTSLIPHMTVNADNMRMSIEHLWGWDKEGHKKEEGVYFETFESQLLNSGLQIGQVLVATQSITLVLQNGPMRDITSEGLRASVIAPIIDIETRNGPIWLTNVLASESITLRTGAGGINVTESARAPVIQVRNHGGYIGGCYRAEQLSIKTENGDVDAAVWLVESDGDKDVGLPGRGKKRRKKWSNVRSVEVESNISGTRLRYMEQDRSIELHSQILSQVGSILVEHASGFQGVWNASTEVGHLLIQEPKSGDVESGKRLVTDAMSQWPVGHWGRGRTWWGETWQSRKMKGSTRATSKTGSVRLDF